MTRQLLMRSTLNLLVAASVIPGSLQRTPQTANAAAPQGSRSTLRVGMWTLWHDRELLITPDGPPEKTLMQTCQRCAPGVLRSRAKIRAEGDAITLAIDEKTVHLDGVWFHGIVTLGAHGETVMIRNPVVITSRAGVLSIVATLPIESYVERVVASESSTEDHLESLEALAIVVRTFALHEAHSHSGNDVCDSTHCQLLHWHLDPERAATAHAATLATAGETLWFHGQRALAYFSKDCGGHTASPNEVWPRAHAIPYLPSHVDTFCSGHSQQWASELTRSELTAALAKAGLARPGWRSLSVVRRGASGRAVTLKLDQTEISAEDFRLAAGESLGWNKIPSAWFELNQQGDKFFVHGRGWGHGVGLCQVGAAAMAAHGRSAGEILHEYFPGTQAADESTGHEWRSSTGSGFIVESLDPADAMYLPDLNRERALASQRSGLNMSSPITVRTFPSTPAFRDATLAPGWVAAFTQGYWIGTQPLRTLAARHLLSGTMRHEFLHALVEQQAGPKAPLWMREGLVEVWAKSGGSEASRSGNSAEAPALTLAAVDAALIRASTEADSATAHRAAAWYAAQLLSRYGRAQVVAWLRSGLPANVATTLGQR